MGLFAHDRSARNRYLGDLESYCLFRITSLSAAIHSPEAYLVRVRNMSICRDWYGRRTNGYSERFELPERNRRSGVSLALRLSRSLKC